MKVLCAPDSFKGSLTAAQAADAMARGVRRADPTADIDTCPISDGGEGFTEAIALANPHTAMLTTCRDPLGRPIEAAWCMVHGPDGHDTAVIEMASASGLILLTEAERDATATSTYGTGELIADAVTRGARHVVLGIGGSATNDGGCGMAQALGGWFRDHEDRPIDQPITGGMLGTIARVDVTELGRRLRGVTVTVACDVTNPLTGPDGAAHVYGPQKGASAEQVKHLDAGLIHLARIWRGQLGVEVEHTPGAGAAGGLGGGLIAFCHAGMRSGLDIVLEAVHFEKRVRGCDLCLTGEGSLDAQSLEGKAVPGVARAATEHGVPTIALVGTLGPGHEKAVEAGLKDAIEIAPGLPAEESMARASELLEAATALAISMHM